jgi:hypothetical protein
MSAFSVYTENKILDHILMTAAWTMPTASYLALFTSDAGLEDNVEGSQTEVSGGSYVRLDASTSFPAAAGGTVTNSVAELIFSTATADWGQVTHFAVMDAATSGNVLMWGPLTGGGREIKIGDSPRFLLSTLTLSVD